MLGKAEIQEIINKTANTLQQTTTIFQIDETGVILHTVLFGIYYITHFDRNVKAGDIAEYLDELIQPTFAE